MAKSKRRQKGQHNHGRGGAQPNQFQPLNMFFGGANNGYSTIPNTENTNDNNNNVSWCMYRVLKKRQG
jgi:hypothetical protein